MINVAGFGNVNAHGNVENSFNLFAPRLGIAYQLSQKTVIRMGYGRSFDVGTFGSHFGHAVTQNLPVLATQEERGPTGAAFEAAFNLASGPTTFDITTQCDFQATGTCPLPDGIFTRARPQRQVMLTIDSWNLAIQHQITPTMSFEVAYVGNKGTHVFAGDGPGKNINQPILTGFTTGVSANDRKPFFSRFGWTQTIIQLEESADNHYNSLQVKLNKRFSGGLQFVGHYTWAKVLGENGDYFIYDSKLNYGPREWDRKHVFLFNSLWEIPVGRGKRALADASPIVDHILGGWQLGSVVTWQSGLPFSPSYRDCGPDRDTGPCRPNLVGSVGSGSAGQFFQTSGTEGLINGETGGPWQRPQPGTFGSATLNSLRGPRFFNTDLSITKKVFVGEQTRVEFHAQAFNIFNHVNLANPNSCVDCDINTDGRIFGLAPNAQMRQWQFGLRIAF